MGPTPYQFLSAALGACTSITLRMYAERKNIPLTGLTVDVSHSKSHADDSEDLEKPCKIDRFVRTIRLEGAIKRRTARRGLRIADLCPVHKTLEGSAQIDTELADEGDRQHAEWNHWQYRDRRVLAAIWRGGARGGGHAYRCYLLDPAQIS